MSTILLIEDDEFLRDALTLALTQNGHVVTPTADGEEGVRAYRAEPADLVITDIVMPNKDGTAVIAELRRDYPELRVIAICGGRTDHAPLYLKIASAFGASRALTKPFTLSALLGAVDEILLAS